MYHAFVKNRDPAVLDDFKKFRNKLNSDLKKAKCEYYQNKFVHIQNDHKKVWETINYLTSRKQTRSSVKEILINNKILVGTELVDEMNRHFTSIGTSTGKNASSNNCMPAGNQIESIMLFPTTPTEIDKIIGSLKNDVAAGDDEIKVLPIKYTANIIGPILSHIINMMLECGNFPDELKIAKVTPVYKGGGVTSINNYRPISVLPVFSKIFERVINDRITVFFKKYHIITPAQYGFKKEKSAESALIDIKDKIAENIENKLVTLGLFLDLKKAFDTVQHDILLKKLNIYGIRGIGLKLIKSYLNERYQYVCLNNESSSKMKIKHGVPQGSILGPLLFLAYINDITEITGSPQLVMYADDTNVFFAGETIQIVEKLANDYLLKLSKWLETNRLGLNTSKTKYVIFKPINKRDHSSINITFEGTLPEQVTEQKFLGVWFTEDLSWSTHVNMLKAELSRVTGSIYKVHSLLPTWLKQALYYSLFYSKMSYGILVWGTTTETNYNKLIILQKKILRMYENYRGDRRNLSTQPLFNKYNMLKADQVFYFKLLQLIHRNKLHTTPTYNLSTYNIRNPIRKMPAIRTNYGRQRLNFQINKTLNRKDMFVDFHQPFNSFKCACRRMLVTSEIAFSSLLVP